MFSDLKLFCGDERVELPCHRAFLSVRSPVFMAMFEHDTIAQTREIQIPDIESQVAERMLASIYSGNINSVKPDCEIAS